MGHGWTYSGHTLGTAAGLANLDILERESLTENTRDTGVYLQQQFYEAFDNHPQVGEVHGMGLVDALEFVADKTKKQRFDADWKVYPKVQRCVLSKNWPCYAEQRHSRFCSAFEHYLSRSGRHHTVHLGRPEFSCRSVGKKNIYGTVENQVRVS